MLQSLSLLWKFMYVEWYVCSVPCCSCALTVVLQVSASRYL